MTTVLLVWSWIYSLIYIFLNKSIDFNGETYAVNMPIESTLKLDWYRLGYRYSIVETGKANLAIGANIHIIKADIGLVSAATSDFYSQTVGLPILALNGSYQINSMFGIEGMISGITAGSSGNYVQMYGGITANCLLVKNGMWRLGYQYKKLSIDIDDLDGDLKFQGAYLGYRYKFSGNLLVNKKGMARIRELILLLISLFCDEICCKTKYFLLF